MSFVSVRLPLGVAALVLAACQSAVPDRHATSSSKVAASLPPPSACQTVSTEVVPKLNLPRTEIPRQQGAADAGPAITQVNTVNRPLAEAGAWHKVDAGWSVLALDIASAQARTLAVRLNTVTLPPQSQAWLCSAGTPARHGPYPVNNGELWTPGVPGAQVRLEIWVPNAQREQFSGFLADVYSAYQ